MHSKDENARKADPRRYQLPRTSGKHRVPPPAEHAGPRSRSAPPSLEQLNAGLKACQDCAGLCLRSVTMCLDVGGETAGTHHVATLQDCADICETTARFIARGSPHLNQLCRTCAAICALCAQECNKIDTDTCIVETAQACRLCAETCLSLTVHADEG